MKVSVIIPTYRDWGRLQMCLDALECQTFDKSRFEIIVVNNDPSDAPPLEIAFPSNCQLITESATGSYAARNAGIRISRGEIIAFTDSDCVPDKKWLEKAYSFFVSRKSDGISRIAGGVAIFAPGDEDLGFWFDKILAFRQHRYVKKGVCVTANLIVRRGVFDRVGFFNEKMTTGGDFEWNDRAGKLGEKIVLLEACFVSHPNRSVKEIISKQKRVYSKRENHIKTNRGAQFFKGFRLLIPYLSDLEDLFKSRKVSLFNRTKVFSLLFYLRLLVFCQHMGYILKR